MSLKWTDSAGILRKNEPFEENKEELLVFGYSCKLFRDDEKAQHIDQGKHLIPWMGDETNKIDRYDARGALYDLQSLEPPQGGYDWRHILNDAEKRIEQFCDKERYRALYCDEEEEELYREEELKRLHASSKATATSGTLSYGEVAFNYESDTKSSKLTNTPTSETGLEEDPFIAPAELNIPEGLTVPLTMKHHTIIVKTASFIASHGAQMEILLKTKQAGNSQFDFLSVDCPLYVYYRHVLEAIKNGVFKPQAEEVEEKEKASNFEAYLHPSLVAPEPVESAPFIPTINYKPSADCAYTILVSKITGTKPVVPTEEELDKQGEQFADSELAPPGTRPLTLPKDLPNGESSNEYTQEQLAQYYAYYGYYMQASQIEKGPVLYGKTENSQLDENLAEQGQLKPPGVDDEDTSQKKKSLGLNLIAYSDSEGGTDSDDNEDGPSAILMPTPEVQLVIDKMAAYVVKNGEDFEKVVIAKNDPRFNFLNPSHQYHAYYKSKLASGKPKIEVKTAKSTTLNDDTGQDDEKDEEEVGERKVVGKEEKVGEISRKSSEKKIKKIAPVSFSIKKLKEPDPLLTNTALPYESSTDEEQEGNENDSKSTSNGESKETAKTEQQIAQHAAADKSTATVLQKTSEVKAKSETDNRANSKVEEIKKDKNYSDDVITIEEDAEPTELIDLTGDVSDDRLTSNGVLDDKTKQLERKRRAAAFLAAMKVKGSPDELANTPVAGAVVERNTLASVMVKTLLDLQAKKEQEENAVNERRKKRRHKGRGDFSSDGSDHGHIHLDRNEKYKNKSKRTRYSRSERPYKKSLKHKKERSYRETSRKKKSKDRSRSSSKRSEKCLELLRKLDDAKATKEKPATPPRETRPKEPRSVAEVMNHFNLGPDLSDEPKGKVGGKDKTDNSDVETNESEEESGETASSNSGSDVEL